MAVARQISGGLTVRRSALTSRGRRLGAQLLDGVLLIVTLVIGWVVWSLIVWNRAQSPGKQLMGMYVHDLRRDAPARWGRMFLREFIVDGVLVKVSLGFFGVVSALWIFTNSEKQRLTDKMMSTVVLDGRPVRDHRRWPPTQ